MTQTNDPRTSQRPAQTNGNGYQNGAPAQQLVNGAAPANSNGTSSNGNGNGQLLAEPLDQPVVLRQPQVWSRAVIWTLMGVTATTIVWSFVAQVEEAVPAQGKLEPQGTVAEVQVPVGGVVQEVAIKDGDRVEKGDILLRLDPTVSKSEQASLKRVRALLLQENAYYRDVMQGGGGELDPGLAANLPSQNLSLAQNRVALMAENQLYRMQLGLPAGGAGLTAEERQRFQSGQNEIVSRINAAQLEVDQLQRQLAQAEIQLTSARELLRVDTGILEDLTELYRNGGIAKLQYRQQEQQVQTRQANVAQLEQEAQRLRLAIAQAGERVQNTVSVSETDLFGRIADNEKRIAEIDSQLSKLLLDNEKRMAEIDSQISQASQTLNYQVVKAPISGTVFDLQANSPQYVVNNTEPVLKIVPADALVAKVFITNRDIGFVRQGMKVDVRVDSFPFSEFGDIKGELVQIGSDALPPDDVYPFYRFPAKVRLDGQYIERDGSKIPLQSGMSVSTNIKIRKRPVISIFTDLFTSKVESLKFVR